MLKTCGCLWESGLHSNAQVYVFKHGISENMRKSLHSSGANFLQSLLFPATSKTPLTLSFLHIYIYKGFPRQKHVAMCQTLVLCTNIKIMFRGCIMHQAHSQQIWQTHPGSISLLEQSYTAQLRKPWVSQHTPGPRPRQTRNVPERPRHTVEPSRS